MSDIDVDSDNNESIKNVDTTKLILKMNEQLTSKELNAPDDQDLSSDSSDFEPFECRKNEIIKQTKEQKQKHNEEIVISTSLSEKNGVVFRDLDRRNTTENIFQNCKIQDCNDKGNHNHFFIDASSLRDETELCFSSSVPNESPKPSNSKLTKFKVEEVTENHEFTTTEFQKEIKVTDNLETIEFDSKPPINYLRQESEPSTSRYSIDKCFSSLDSDMLNKELYHPEKGFHLNSLTKSNQDVSVLESKKTGFVRSGTFEIEDTEEALIRKNNERRQGSLVFQNSIQQYSTHLSSENLMPATPFNSIIHVNDSILNPTRERPLDSIFYEKTESVITEDGEKSDEEIVTNPIKREESVPIISGGIGPTDCITITHTIKKDVDSIPCISTSYVEAESCSSVPRNVKTAWVIDMNIPETKQEQKEKNSNKSSLGFFIDLTDVPTEKTVKTPPVENEEKKNIFSMFIDFQAPKKEMPSRLSQSLCAKKEKITNEMSKSTNSIKKDKDVDKENVNGEVVQIRHKRSSSNVTNRHSWNGIHENEHFHTRTYSLSDKQFRSLNIEITSQSVNETVNGTSVAIENGLENINEDLLICDDIQIEEIHQQIEENHKRIEEDHQIKPVEQIHQSSVQNHKVEQIVETHSPIEIQIVEPTHESKDVIVETIQPHVDKIPEIIETKPSEPVQNEKSEFVSLSDLYKPAPKIVTTEQPVYTRMTRSIPETSWIESKLLMTRSIGYRTASKLLPNMSTSTPSNFFSKQSGQDSDEMMSEVSDFSSIQSSTALEISTEDTSQSYSSSYQVQQSTNRLGHDLLRMFLEEISPDVTVEVGGRHLKAHKCILSSRCQYFAAMLSGGWVESSGNVISLQGFSYQAVYFAMCHIYSGAADIPDTIDLVEMATLADMLGLEGLKEIVANTLKLKYCHLFHKPCSVCVVGVLECLPLAAAYGLDELYRKALKWITRYFVRVWATRTFASLSKELLDKCYQQHVIHMSPDNILETVLCVDKLLVTLPNVRWAEIVHELATQLADACQFYIMQHFSSVLSSASFLSLGKELNWNISKLEGGLLHAAEHLSPEQSCRSFARIHKLQSFLEISEECWSENFTALVRNIYSRVQDCVVRQAVRVSHTSAWTKLDPNLRARIQEISCLPLEHTYVARQSRSTSGSRNLDLRQIKIAMQQHSRRTQSTDSRPKKVEPKPKPVEPQPPRPRTWPAQSHIKTKIISSSDSSRTSSPAMKKLNKKNELIKNTKSVSNTTINKTKVSNLKPKNDKKVESNVKTTVKKEPVKTIQQNTLTKKKPKPVTNNVLKSNIQKTTEKIVKPPSVNKENRTNSGKQSKSGSSSSTQQSPSLLNKNRPNSTNTSTPSSQNRSDSNPYSGSPSLRRSLLLAARTPQVPVKPVSPATNKRLARIQASNSLTSPTKSSAAKCVNSRTKVVKQKSTEKKIESKTEHKPEKLHVERSGTFLKDEPTVFSKN